MYSTIAIRRPMASLENLQEEPVVNSLALRTLEQSYTWNTYSDLTKEAFYNGPLGGETFGGVAADVNKARFEEARSSIGADDLERTMQNITDFEADRMTRLLDHRINEYYPMMMTTNLDQSEFYSILGDRIASRLLGNFHIIELEGLDKRLEK